MAKTKELKKSRDHGGIEEGEESIHLSFGKEPRLARAALPFQRAQVRPALVLSV